MIIKNNFQRNIILSVLVLFNNLILSFVFFILRICYNVPFFVIILIYVLFIIFYNTYWEDFSNKIFLKYCNKECNNCSMWHCDYNIKIRSKSK